MAAALANSAQIMAESEQPAGSSFPLTDLLVSVIIPTIGRPDLLLRALKSVFNQTHRAMEVIVVVDGPDEKTVRALQALDDKRLQVIVNPQSLTAAGARNTGANHAKGDWIAFLDDDDEWLPTKIARQLEFARGRGALVSCLSQIVTPTSTKVRPSTPFDNCRPLDEYLFDRPSPFSSVGFIQTSSYLMLRSLYLRTLFRTDNPHDDWDFLIRMSKFGGIRIETVPEVLVIVHVDEERGSLSGSGTWKASLSWIDSIRPIITQRAYGGFCLGVVASRATKEHDFPGFIRVLCRAFRRGSPRLWQFAATLGLCLLPERTRRGLRSSRR